MILCKTRKGFPSGRGKKCSKPSMNNMYKDTAFVGSGRNNCIHASSWFLFNQTCLLCKINKILTKAWLMDAPCKQAALRLGGANNRQWLTMSNDANISFNQAKTADSPHYWHSEPRTSQTETSHTWAKNTTADNTLHKYEFDEKLH